jgi:hypothetical protein
MPTLFIPIGLIITYIRAHHTTGQAVRLIMIIQRIKIAAK